MEDWILFVFKSYRCYLVPAECENEAWILLAKRQSISMKNCKKQYKLINTLNSSSDILKI